MDLAQTVIIIDDDGDVEMHDDAHRPPPLPAMADQSRRRPRSPAEEDAPNKRHRPSAHGNRCESPILPWVPFSLRDKRKDGPGHCNPRSGRMKEFMLDPLKTTDHPLRPLLPADFSLQRLCRVCAYFPGFDAAQTVFRATMWRDNVLIATGSIGRSGEFAQAMEIMTFMAGTSPEARKAAAAFSITWLIEDGNPASDQYLPFEAYNLDVDDVESAPDEPESETEEPESETEEEPESETEELKLETEQNDGEESPPQSLDMLSQCLARHEDLSDETLWPEACAFFSHDPALRSDTDEVYIAGCKLTLLPWQAVDVFAYFRITIGGKGLTPSQGALCAHPMGQGKSRIAMAIIAVRRLCSPSSSTPRVRALRTATLPRRARAVSSGSGA